MDFHPFYQDKNKGQINKNIKSFGGPDLVRHVLYRGESGFNETKIKT